MRETSDVEREFKAVAQDVLQLGAKCVQAGRSWLSERRNEMNHRNDESRGSRGRHGAPRDQGQSGGWDQQDRQRQQGRPYGQSSQYQQARGEEFHPYQQSQHNQQDRFHGHAGEDYGRAQAYGQGGMEREYGQDFESTQATGPRYDRQQGRNAQGLGPRRGGGRGGQGGYRAGPQSYGDSGRQAGEGYGNSSGYGSPRGDSYVGDAGIAGYQGQQFAVPGDTQASWAGGGRSGSYGGFAGMGPRNYSRSDERINEDLCERLTDDPDVDASDLEVKVSGGTVTLEGTVDERWMKHRAEDLADACSGVRNVENRIRVRSRYASQGAGTEDSTDRQGSSGGTETGAPSTRTSSKGGTAH